jgi:hypothetical protein
VLQAMMGHSSIKTTEGYMGVDQCSMREQVGKINLGAQTEPLEIERLVS